MFIDEKDPAAKVLRQIEALDRDVRDRLAGALTRRVSVVQLLRQGHVTYRIGPGPGASCDEADYLLFGGNDTTVADGAWSIKLDALLCDRVPGSSLAAERTLQPVDRGNGESWLTLSNEVGPVLLTPHGGPALLSVDVNVARLPLPGVGWAAEGSGTAEQATVTLAIRSFDPDGRPKASVGFSWQCLVRAVRWVENA
jgi:hypothetical protein